MKQYSSNRAQKGKLAYRTPSRFIAQKTEAYKRLKIESKRRLGRARDGGRISGLR